MDHVIGADQHLDVRGEPGQVETPERALAVLAGDERRAVPVAAHRLQHGGDAIVGRDHRVVVRQVVVAIRGDQFLQDSAAVVPLGELHAERGADAAQPILIASRGDAVHPEGMVIAVQDQLHRVDERPVEIEKQGVVAGHGRQTYRVAAGTEARRRGSR